MPELVPEQGRAEALEPELEPEQELAREQPQPQPELAPVPVGCLPEVWQQPWRQ